MHGPHVIFMSGFTTKNCMCMWQHTKSIYTSTPSLKMMSFNFASVRLNCCLVAFAKPLILDIFSNNSPLVLHLSFILLDGSVLSHDVFCLLQITPRDELYCLQTGHLDNLEDDGNKRWQLTCLIVESERILSTYDTRFSPVFIVIIIIDANFNHANLLTLSIIEFSSFPFPQIFVSLAVVATTYFCSIDRSDNLQDVWNTANLGRFIFKKGCTLRNGNSSRQQNVPWKIILNDNR